MKLCINCQSYVPDIKECINIKVFGERNPVTGYSTIRFSRYPDDLRAYGFVFSRLLNICGKEGRWFEAKV